MEKGLTNQKKAKGRVWQVCAGARGVSKGRLTLRRKAIWGQPSC